MSVIYGRILYAVDTVGKLWGNKLPQDLTAVKVCVVVRLIYLESVV